MVREMVSVAAGLRPWLRLIRCWVRAICALRLK
jgi:hypothetical protein